MHTADWMNAIAAHAARAIDTPIADLLQREPGRTSALTLDAAGIHASFARQRVDQAGFSALLEIAQRAKIGTAIRDLLGGQSVNVTEGRSALHAALRGDVSGSAQSAAAASLARDAHQRMDQLAAELEASEVRDVVSIGIGGSDLGPRLLADALADPAHARFRVHFLSNVDAHAARRLLVQLDRARTAVVLVSKTFTTQETLLNGALLRQWLGDDRRMFAVTANAAGAMAAGVSDAHILPMWDWVGGRYSLWSTVGWSARLAVGDAAFSRLLKGAAAMDAHLASAPLAQNLPVLHGLFAVWNRNGLGFDSMAVLPYDERLRLLPAYLQQLVMESLGKSVRGDGSPVHAPTAPVWWGTVGTDCQHSYMQALHQGTDTIPVDFIGVIRPSHEFPQQHRVLLANLLAQAQALAEGVKSDDPHRRHPGNRPSTMLLLDELDPERLGALLAMYEHSVYTQSVLWGINAFDQFGVERGKRIAIDLLAAFDQPPGAVSDPVTRALLARIQSAAA